MLGFDALYVANEGKLIAIVPETEAEAALTAIRRSSYGSMATRIGKVLSSNPGRVLLHTPFGSTRILDVLAGEMLPRIC
jgi:hydrogenase expression/formation protein HypE